MPAGTSHLNRLQAHLDSDYSWLRDEILSLHPNLDDDAIHTRQLLGFALINIAGCPEDEAVAHITDGKDDRGIDALYFNREELNLYIFQSKYVKNPTKHSPIKESEALVFADGIDEIFDSTIFTRGNEALVALKDEITGALSIPNVEPIPTLISTSEKDITKGAMGRIDRRLFQSTGQRGALKYVRLSDLYEFISTYGDSSGIEIKLTLNDFKIIPSPYMGYYGWITGDTLAQLYKKHGTRLFCKNLRSSLGKTPINDEMANTAKDTPEYFWYFNNGVTFISNKISRTLRGGSSADDTDLTITNGSIVNGAQTTATLGELLKNEETRDKLPHIKCLVRILEIPADHEDFATDVTRYNNSQNDLGPKDFISLDPFQQRLRKELEREYAINYNIRSGEGTQNSDPANISLQDATLALVACGTSIEHAVRSKDKISSLWRDTEKPPYTTIFDSQTITALALRKAVCSNRHIEEFLSRKVQKRNSDDVFSARMSTIATHGNRLFAFYILRGTNIYRDEQPYEDFESEITRLDLDPYFEQFVLEVYEQFSGSYMAVLFKNAKKCTKLLNALPRLTPPVV